MPILLAKLMLNFGWSWADPVMWVILFVRPYGNFLWIKTWINGISIACNTKSSPVCLSLSVLPGLNGSGGVFNTPPMMSGVFPYVHSQKETEWKINVFFSNLCMCLQNEFWRGKLSSAYSWPLGFVIVLVSQHAEWRHILLSEWKKAGRTVPCGTFLLRDHWDQGIRGSKLKLSMCHQPS